MRVRIVITGCVAGAICYFALYSFYYKIETAKIVPGWPNLIQALVLPPWAPTVVFVFCGLILLASGWVAARWSWANTWHTSAAYGTSTGLLAGCLIYDFIGVYWFSVQSNSEILKNYYNPITEAQGTRILVESLIKTEMTLYPNFIWCVLICATLGALGGFASAIDLKDRWGTHPRNPAGWLFRLPAYLLMFSGILNLIVTIAVMETFTDKLLNTIVQMKQKYGIELEHILNKTDFLQFNYLVCWFFAILPAGIIVGWFIRLYRRGGSLNLLSITGVVIMFVSILLIIWFVAPGMFSPQVISAAMAMALAIAALLATWVGVMTRDESEGFPYHSSDWVGYLIGYGILGGTQIIMGVVAFSLPAALIGIINIPHLITGGIVDKNPVSQVTYLFGIQIWAAIASMAVSAVIALIIVNLVSFIRGAFDIRETYHPQESSEYEID